MNGRRVKGGRSSASSEKSDGLKTARARRDHQNEGSPTLQKRIALVPWRSALLFCSPPAARPPARRRACTHAKWRACHYHDGRQAVCVCVVVRRRRERDRCGGGIEERRVHRCRGSGGALVLCVHGQRACRPRRRRGPTVNLRQGGDPDLLCECGCVSSSVWLEFLASRCVSPRSPASSSLAAPTRSRPTRVSSQSRCVRASRSRSDLCQNGPDDERAPRRAARERERSTSCVCVDGVVGRQRERELSP